MIKQYDRVVLKDGIQGIVTDVLGQGAACVLEVLSADGSKPIDVRIVSVGEIERVIAHATGD